jgi:hypothetical protein
MTTSNLTGLGGQALMLGGVTTALHLVARSVVTSSSGVVELALSHGWAVLNLLGAGGAMLLLVGLGALLPTLVNAAGLLGLVGLGLVAWFWLFSGVFLNLYAALLMPWMARAAPWMLGPEADVPLALLVVFASAVLALCAGTAFLAVPFLRRKLEPFWVGIALPGGAALALIGDLIARQGPSSTLALNLATNAGPVLVALALGSLGLRLARASR